MTYKAFDLSEKTVLVTGANSGIGYGMAEALAQAGAKLVIWGRRPDRNAIAAAAFRKYDVEVLEQTVDMSKEDEVNLAFAEAVRRCGTIHAVFANAGRAGTRTPFEQIDTKAYREVVEANQFGTFFTLRAAAQHLLDAAKAGSPPGSIVITGSASMVWGIAGNASYAMTKGALDALTRTMAVEYGKYGIRVNCLLPGLIESEIGHTASTSEWTKLNCSMRRAGRGEEMGGIAVYLASDASSYHTGTSIIIDGGLTIQRGVA